MPALGHTHPTPYADVQVVGIPRALLYHRYGTLWTALFERLGRTTVLSRPTDREVVARGEALAVDECCLASKVYLGHVADLLGRCDAVFVPSMANLGLVKQFCTKFHALPDIVANTFGDQVHVVSCHVGVFEEKRPFEQAFADLAQSFGATPRQAKRAVREAFKAQERHDHELAQAAEARLCARRDDPQDVRILLAAHPYISHDRAMGAPVAELLARLGAEVVLADECDHGRGYAASLGFSQTMPWVVNRELVGTILRHREHVDGIVLVSAFPCGPDSMTDDAVMRCIKGTPILNLTIDAQSGTAGLETRVESFVDILRYQKQGGYVR